MFYQMFNEATKWDTNLPTVIRGKNHEQFHVFVLVFKVVDRLGVFDLTLITGGGKPPCHTHAVKPAYYLVKQLFGQMLFFSFRNMPLNVNYFCVHHCSIWIKWADAHGQQNKAATSTGERESEFRKCDTWGTKKKKRKKYYWQHFSSAIWSLCSFFQNNHMNLILSLGIVSQQNI